MKSPRTQHGAVTKCQTKCNAWQEAQRIDCTLHHFSTEGAGGRKSMGVGRRDHNQERSKRKRAVVKALALTVKEESLGF